ncbi:MAG: hypothetical protein V4513_01470 [Pseudomonadota bacterium]
MLVLLFLAAASALPPATEPQKFCGYYGGPFIAPCPNYGPQQRIRGIWYTGFEESGFVANATSARLSREIGEHGPDREGYLIFEGDEAVKAGVRYKGCTQAIALEFIGRESFSPWEHDPKFTVFIVDRLLSSRPLGKVRTLGLKGYDKECVTKQ